jgi:uncharacterized membrane protein YkoI
MKTSTKLILTAAAIGSLGLGGLAKLVNAAQTQSSVAVVPATQAIEKSDGDGETNDDAQEAQKLQPLAKITPQQAQRSAETSVKGTASHVKLENENGSLVYAVMVGQTEVIVDAGNGNVLDTSTPTRERNEKTQLRSSVQVPQSADDDGETNDNEFH